MSHRSRLFEVLVDLHCTYLGDIERGSCNVSLLNLDRVATPLSLTMPELFQRVERF